MEAKSRWHYYALLLSLIEICDLQVPGQGSGQRVCPKGWFYVNDWCWKYETNPRAWDEANRQCQGQRSTLASIHNEEENRFIYSMMQVYGRNSNGGFRRRMESASKKRLAQPIDLRSCFPLTRNAVLIGFAQTAREVTSPEVCQRDCLDSQNLYGFDCLSLLYYPETNDCILNSGSRTSEPSSFTTDTFGENVDYYENVCSNTQPIQPTFPPPIQPPIQPPVTQQPLPPTRRNCFDVYRNQVLVGYADEVIDSVTLDQCEQACLNAQLRFRLTCNSFVYYSAQQVCIINEVTRREFPNLFSQEQGADYYEKVPGLCGAVPGPGPGPTPGPGPLPLPGLCPTQDVLFIIDGSGSIGPQSFEMIRQFLSQVTSEFNVGFNRTNIGVIQFNEQPFTEFPLRSFQTQDEVNQAINGIQWRNGRTMIGRALQYALDNELIRTQGDRMTVPNTIVTLTDGLSQDNPLPPAQDMRTLGMQTYAIGVTDAVFDEQLLNIAGDPNRVYKVQDFTRLDSRLKDALIQDVCNGYRGPGQKPSPVFPTQSPIGQGVWVGLRDQFNGGNYVWSDSSPLDYRNWRFGQPSRGTSDNCGVIEYDPLARWSNANCASPNEFVCKQAPSGLLNDYIQLRSLG